MEGGLSVDLPIALPLEVFVAASVVVKTASAGTGGRDSDEDDVDSEFDDKEAVDKLIDKLCCGSRMG